MKHTLEWLQEKGLLVQNITNMTLSFTGKKNAIENLFGVELTLKTKDIDAYYGGKITVQYWTSNKPLMHPAIEQWVEYIELSMPGVPMHVAYPPTVSTPYYYLELNQLPGLLQATLPHANNILGTGVRVSVVDSGFYTKVIERQAAPTGAATTVDYDIIQVYAVCDDVVRNQDECAGDKYYKPILGGSVDPTRRTINFGFPEFNPAPGFQVKITYSCIHPYFKANNYNIVNVKGAENDTPIMGSINTYNIFFDFRGHGQPVAANLLSIAPDIEFSLVQYESIKETLLDTTINKETVTENKPFEAFKMALRTQSPQIITCSWGLAVDANISTNFVGLRLEIAAATAAGVLVIFSAGNNARTDNPFQSAISIAHPDVISVGGAYPQGTITPPFQPTGQWEASNFASSFDSFLFQNAQRHCPDIVGIVGQTPNGSFIMSPTQPGFSLPPFSLSDEFGSAFDGTSFDDGWVVSSGTSAAAPQVAGIAALLLQQFPDLTPRAIKNILMNSALDITQGQSANGDVATTGWDKATGFGLVQARAAIAYLWSGYVPFIRDYREDIGTAPHNLVSVYESPDILVKQALVKNGRAQDLWGIVVKHRNDLTGKAYAGQKNFIYTRFQNRGQGQGDSNIHLLMATQTTLNSPASWVNLGTIPDQKITAGNFRVSESLAWNAPSITGIYYLIAVLDNANSWSTISSLSDFENYILNNRFAACKEIEVITPSTVTVGQVQITAQAAPGQVSVQIIVNNDIYDEVSLVELEFMPPFIGPKPLKNKIQCTLESQSGTSKTFIFKGLLFESSPKGFTYTLKTTLLDSERLPIGNTQEWVIIIL